jgi:hypothetical protein
MFEIIIGVVAGVGVAFGCMMFYRRGIKDGMAINRKEEPTPIIATKPEPMTDEELKAAEKFNSAYETITGYNPYGVKND